MDEMKELLDEYKDELFFKRLLTTSVVAVCTLGAVMAITSVIICVELGKLNLLLQCFRGY